MLLRSERGGGGEGGVGAVTYVCDPGFLAGPPVWSAQVHRVWVTVNTGGAGKLLAQQTFHLADRGEGTKRKQI